jgi:hypothetical protein
MNHYGGITGSLTGMRAVFTSDPDDPHPQPQLNQQAILPVSLAAGLLRGRVT